MEFNRLIPELSVSDFRKSLWFYRDVLGFAVEYSREESSFAMLSLQGSQIMIEEVNDTWHTGTLEYPFGRGVNFQIEVDSVQSILAGLEKQYYPLFRGVEDAWYRQGDVLLGNREFLVQDPDGYLLRFAEDLGEKPA